MQVEQLGGLGLGGQVFVTGLQRVYQLLVQRRDAQPDFAGSHFINRQLRAIARHEVLEQLMGDIQVFLELLPALLGVFAKHRQGALVLASGEYFKVDIVLFQQAVDVGQLGHHANRAEDGKRCADDLLADARHHVAAAGRDLVDTHRQRHARLADPRQLRGRQAIAVDHATAAFKAQYHFVLGRGQAQQRSDFVAQAVGGRRLDVPVKIQHKHPWLGFGGFLLFFLGLALGLAQGLELILVEQGLLQALAQAFVKVIELADLQLPGILAPALAAQRRKTDQHHQDGDDQRDGFSQKTCILSQKLHGTPYRNGAPGAIAPAYRWDGR